MEIIELFPRNEENEPKRVLMFKVPAAIAGMPTAWKNQYFARSGESLVRLNQQKIDEIRMEERRDWSKQVIHEATIEFLDPDAIALARKNYKEKNTECRQAPCIDCFPSLFVTQSKDRIHLCRFIGRIVSEENADEHGEAHRKEDAPYRYFTVIAH